MAYGLEQCWHRVPGGTATAAIEIARAMPSVRPDVELVGVTGRHRVGPTSGYQPPIAFTQMSVGGPLFYQTSLRLQFPRVESATGPVDLVHCTTIIPMASKAKMVATVHDLAFLKFPEFFSRNGNVVFRRSLKILLNKAEMVLCSSKATLADCAEYGFADDRLVHVPLGVKPPVEFGNADQFVGRQDLPSEYLLFVGTLEPRKNLGRLIEALASLGDSVPDLVVVGAAGWGDLQIKNVENRSRVHFLGFVSDQDLALLYKNASALCCPSLMEGFGLPILEAMSYGTPVVTSFGSSTQEVAGGAAILVDPMDVSSIASGVQDCLYQRNQLVQLGLERASQMTWQVSARRTAQVYDQVLQ